MTKTFKQIEARSKFMGVFPFEFKDAGSTEKGKIPDTIHLLPVGSWDHDIYGPILINNQDINEFAQNFNAKIRNGVFITAGHEGYDELPANGWVTAVEVRPDGLWGKVEWNELGKEALSDKQYKFFSPELYRDYEDPETHQIYRNVLIGGALTKSPYFKELEAIVFSEKKFKKTFNENNTMNLGEILAKDIATLSDEEKAFLKEHAAELTEDQKTSHASIITDAATETDEEKAARIEKEGGDANEAAGLNRDGSPKADEGGSKETMSEKKISMAEYNALKAAADRGDQAFKELEKAKTDKFVGELMFSSTNANGRFLPKGEADLRAFTATLNPAQRLKFSALLAHIPKTTEVFKEAGGHAAADGVSAQSEVDAATEAKLKENTKLKYSDALRQVISENPSLATRLEKEQKTVADANLDL